LENFLLRGFGLFFCANLFVKLGSHISVVDFYDLIVMLWFSDQYAMLIIL